MNVKPRTMFIGDNLPVLRALDSESVDMVYADPPFGSGKKRSAPINAQAAEAMFRDVWSLSDIDVAWSGEIRARAPAVAAQIEAAGLSAGLATQAYMTMMAVRLIDIRRVLKPSGVFYLHCDSTVAAYLKVLCDAVFGARQFRNEVIWKRTSAHNRARRYAPVHDTILMYSRTDAYHWNPVYQTYDAEYIRKKYCHTNEVGARYRLSDLTAPGLRNGESGQPWRGFNPSARGRYWAIPRTWPGADEVPSGTQDALDHLDRIGRIHWPKKGGMPTFVRYLEEMPGMRAQDVITDIAPIHPMAKERTGYPTQRPLALLARLIESSTGPGDMVLDPFCGCATTLVAAEAAGREWIGIDVSSTAVRLVRERMRDDLGLLGVGVIERTDVPRRKGRRSGNIRVVLHDVQRGRCNLCEIRVDFRNLTLDHIIPRAHGGLDDDENLQLLCGPCNSLKGTGTMTAAINKLKRRRQPGHRPWAHIGSSGRPRRLP